VLKYLVALVLVGCCGGCMTKQRQPYLYSKNFNFPKHGLGAGDVVGFETWLDMEHDKRYIEYMIIEYDGQKNEYDLLMERAEDLRMSPPQPKKPSKPENRTNTYSLPLSMGNFDE